MLKTTKKDAQKIYRKIELGLKIKRNIA